MNVLGYRAYLMLIDSCITQLKEQGPSRTCNESKNEEEEVTAFMPAVRESLGSWFTVYGLRFRVWSLGFRV